MVKRSFLGALLGAAIAAASQAQTVYRCEGAGGQAVFQQFECAGGRGKAVEVRPINLVDGNPAGEMGVRAMARRGAEVRAAIARGSVLQGMTEAEMMLVLGDPTVVNTDVIGSNVHRQYVYRRPGGTEYYYTRDGVVTAGQSRPHVDWPRHRAR